MNIPAVKNALSGRLSPQATQQLMALAADPIRVLETQGIVDAVLLSGEIGAEKPSKEAFQAAADALDLPMRDCVMVDDSILNVRGAVEAGLVGVYYQQFDRAIVEITGLLDIEGEF